LLSTDMHYLGHGFLKHPVSWLRQILSEPPTQRI